MKSEVPAASAAREGVAELTVRPFPCSRVHSTGHYLPKTSLTILVKFCTLIGLAI